MTLENADQRLLLADEAKRLRNDPLFNGVVNAILKGYMNKLMSTQPGTPEGITAHASISGLEDIKKQLLAIENDGVMVREELKKEKARNSE